MACDLCDVGRMRIYVCLQDFQTALNAFGETMAASIAHHSSPQGSYLATGFRQVQWLLATFGCYAQRVLSKTDVAVMFLSRKILVDQVGLAAMSTSLPAFYRHPAALAAPQHLPVSYLEGHPEVASRPRSVRAVLGGMLFLVAVESGWQMHHKTVQYLPKNLQAAVSPLQVDDTMFSLLVSAHAIASCLIINTYMQAVICIPLCLTGKPLQPPLTDDCSWGCVSHALQSGQRCSPCLH